MTLAGLGTPRRVNAAASRKRALKAHSAYQNKTHMKNTARGMRRHRAASARRTAAHLAARHRRRCTALALAKLGGDSSPSKHTSNKGARHAASKSVSGENITPRCLGC